MSHPEEPEEVGKASLCSLGNVLKEWREKETQAAMKKEEGFSMQKGSSSGSYCLLGTELSKILLTPNSSETYSRCCLNIKEGDFELGFSISSFTFWAVKHNQISQLLNISEGIVIWLLLKIQAVILEKLPPSDSHIIFCSQWRRSEFKLPLTWSKSTQMLEIGNTAHISPKSNTFAFSPENLVIPS